MNKLKDQFEQYVGKLWESVEEACVFNVHGPMKALLFVTGEGSTNLHAMEFLISHCYICEIEAFVNLR